MTRPTRYRAIVMHARAGQSVNVNVTVPTADLEEIRAAVTAKISETWVQPDLASIDAIVRRSDGVKIWDRYFPV